MILEEVRRIAMAPALTVSCREEADELMSLVRASAARARDWMSA